MEDFEQIRREINAIDQEILKGLSVRRALVAKIIEEKAREGLPLRDPGREEEVLSRLIEKGRALGLDSHLVTRVFHEIIDDSVRSQQLVLLKSSNSGHVGLKRVAFQGIEGAYSHLAAQKHFARNLDQMRFAGYPTFEEVMEAVENATVDYAFLPIENTTAGSINEVSDLLARSTALYIVGEEVFRVEHCLLGIADVPLASIRRVYSHPAALKQCMKFLSTLGNCQIEYYADTAMAARKIKEDQDPTQAAIASEAAARQYGLVILQRDLADQRENFTRFLVIAREPIKVDARIPAKTSLVLAVADEEGALVRALMVFHGHRINLKKLDGSRPRPGAPFQYIFNVDFEGNIAEPNVRAALDELRSATSFLKVLGSYPVEARGRTAPAVQAIVPPKKQDPAAASSGPPPIAEAGLELAGSADERFRLASRRAKPSGTVINVRGVKVGGSSLVVIAGPKLIESRDQVLACARQVKECGGKVLSTSAFRLESGQTQGRDHSNEGYELLAEAGRAYDLAVLVEVFTPAGANAAAKHVDIVQIDSRSMVNMDLLDAVGKVNCPVLLERSPSASLEELLIAAERILARGNQQVILCERGIRTFETGDRGILDLGAVPLLRRMTHLPIVVAVSSAAGRRDLVPPLALAARAVGPHGLVIDIHAGEDSETSVVSPALSFSEFAALMHELYAGNGQKTF